MMTGREDRKHNDLFFTCALIEYIARKTKNRARDVVDALGKARIEKIYDLADIYHSDNIDRVCEDFVRDSNIAIGDDNHVGAAKYAVPSHWDIGKIYKRLIIGIAQNRNIEIVDALFLAYHSFVSEKIDDYNSSFYYDAPQNILNTFLTGVME